MRRLPSLIASTVCLALIWTGASAADRKPPARTAAAAPVQASAALNPAGEGRRAFLQCNCSGCHGARAGGGMGPNIQHAELGDLSDVVREGGEGGMPSYRLIVNSTDVANIAAYLRSIGTNSEPMFNDWWVPVPPK
jgi:mono/diheme cytochrome c family protein